MGSPDFAVPTLVALVAAGHEVALVVCQPDKPAGRGRALAACPVRTAAQQRQLAVACPERIRGPRGAEFVARVRALAPDFIVVAAYGKILPPELLAAARQAPVNVHASLLPRWRGASPIQHAILAGDDETGVSIMRMEEGLDSGGVYTAVREPIRPDDTAGTLAARLAALGAEAVVPALAAIAAGVLAPRPQGEVGITVAPLLGKQDGWLDLARPAEELARRVRAMDPWPGAHTTLAGVPLKVWRARPLEAVDGAAGLVVAVGDEVVVACGSGALAIGELQLAGKKRLAAREFACGARLIAGARLGG
ncbi:MAG: methionyl-tRNA formyltransferase [Deltaproteobacteria bacterium]|nr:methionyl-tRNA formyltransferase [Deltaproteobacteria bacterium]